jgi:carbamate kinase
MTRIVVALGGNALLRRGEPPDAHVQRANVKEAAAAVAELTGQASVVVTHGNGPQVGLLALESAADPALSQPYPLDVLGAESEGMIGYLIEQELENQLPDREVATLLTQTIVSADDPAWSHPTKPIGPVYDQATAQRLADERGWNVRPDGAHWRRVVASPEPQRIVELKVIRLLVDAGVLVVCCGGGGIPVVRRPQGVLQGVEAVVDKDLAAAVLARELEADALLLLTDVPFVVRDWGTSSAQPIARATPEELRALDFAAGSMAPKVEAACRFVEDTGGVAAIGRLADAAGLLSQEAGTLVAPQWWEPGRGSTP